MSLKLRDLIRKVRQCKTAAEERAVIAKESAMIRTAIREEQAHFRHRNVAKLLFMHMLGYPTHFGQLECMKLTASPHFPEKRIGYLGLMLLLSEEADVLMLATNALKNDLTSRNKFVAGLALCAIGNLATADMSRDLAPEVDKHLNSNLPYLRKKACLAMGRCLAKCPDMVEDFVDRVLSLLKDKSHGVLIAVTQLMTQLLMIDFQNAQDEGEDPWDTECRQAFLKLVPTLVKMLRNLLTSGYSPEHDIAGIADPFLQVQLLTLLRLLGTHNEQASEEMNDVLAQVATNTESSKNAGNAILYECVQTIMGIEAEDGLRVLAVNILGRFLLNRDNNIRYVALNTLSRCIQEQKKSKAAGGVLMMDDGNAGGDANSAMAALQRHRTTVVDCLKDPDVSIRIRALELIYHLVNADNVKNLTAELLNYLVLCPREHRADIGTRILKVVDRYSQDDWWKVDTLITTLTIAGREANVEVQSSCVVYISQAAQTDVQAFGVHKLLKAIRDDDGSQHGLLNVGIWCIGEYGDLLLQPFSYTPDNTTTPTNGDAALLDSSGGNGNATVTFEALDPLAIIDTIEHVTQRHACPESVKQRALTAYVKLSDRFANTQNEAALSRLQALLERHQVSHSLELQLRSCEYQALLQATQGRHVVPPAAAAPAPTNDDDPFGLAAPAAAPPAAGAPVGDAVRQAAKSALERMPKIDIKVLQRRLDDDNDANGGWTDGSGAAPAAKAAAPSAADDLLDIFGGGGGGASATTNGGSAAPTSALGGGGTAAAPASDLDLLSDIFSGDGGAAAPAAPAANLFGAAPTMAAIPPAAATPNPMDLFGGGGAAAAPTMNGGGGAAGDPFAALPGSGAPAAVAPMNDLFGGGGAAPVATPPSTPSVKVAGPNHEGLSIEFECSKPDLSNPQKSSLVAHFTNSSGDTIYGLNMQCAVPKYVKMEMQAPSSTTISMGASQVTQKIIVTNSMLGTKNLMLKLKLSFTANGQKVEHMATQSGFPPGQY